ncbi:MAG: O-antigen ligase family protein [Chamaesiphon sp.]|nr:O-antigen ligase family protein [Chamaesiphon sp.]
MSATLLEQFVPYRTRIQIALDKYQYLLSIVATFLFYSNLPDYLYAAPIIPIPPLVWIGLITVLSFPFLKKAANIPKPLLAWMVFYLLISLLSLLTVSGDEISFTDFRAKVLSVLFIVLMYVLFQQKSLIHVKYTILAVVVMSVINNMLELFSPRLFSELNVGRPAGFYIDPNQAGCALVLGMLLGITAIKKPYRWIVIVVAGVGIMATFSRGAIIGWLFCTIIMISGRVLSDQRRKIIVPAILLVLFLASINPLRLLSDYFKGDPSGANWDIMYRLEEFQNPSGIGKEDSAVSRQGVVAGAMVLFSQRPFWGNGLASTRKWMVADISTHNMYLYYMADNGILGILFLPGAVFAVVYRNKGEQSTILVCFAVFVSLWGLFSHEVLAERYTLSSFAILAAMNTNQQWSAKFAQNRDRLGLRQSRAQRLLPPSRQRSQLALPPVPDKETAQLALPPARNQKFIEDRD